MALQHLRSSTADKRPTPAAMSDGQLALNTNLVSPGLFFKDSNGDSVKIGPVHVGTTAPNVTPGAGGQAGNSKGEAWLDTTATNPILKVWNGSAFVAVQPVGTGTVVSTTDSGTVTSTMILDGTILNADINASAAIVDTKLATIATAGKVSNSATTATNANTASAIVARDGSGNFTAGTITAALTGAASSNVLKAGDTMTGALVVPLASAATPSLTFTGDLNTGIYSPGADQVAVATNGTGRLFVDASGNVCLKKETALPNYSKALTVAATDAAIALRANSSGTYTDQGIFFAVDGVNYSQIYNDNIGQLIFRTGSGLSERLRITSAGLVGIGTTSPVATLHIENTAGGDLFYALGSNSDVFKISSDSSTINLDTRNTTGGLAFQIQGTERARIDSSGRLLVGTSAAGGNFHFRRTGSTNADFLLDCESGVNYFVQARFASDVSGCNHHFRKYRGTIASASAVNSGDIMGITQYYGYDGANIIEAASIQGVVDGTPGANDMPGRLVFSTTADGASTPTERMRIDSGGTIYCGQTTNPASSTVLLRVPTGTGNGVNAQITSNTGTSFPWANYNASNTYVGGISCTSTATSFPTSSDYRLKTNVQPLTGAIGLVSQLKPSTFEFNENLGEAVQGFIAHELQEVVPLAVIGEKDAEDANGNPIYQGVDAAKLVPLLTAALQEAIAKIEVLEQRLNDAGIN